MHSTTGCGKSGRGQGWDVFQRPDEVTVRVIAPFTEKWNTEGLLVCGEGGGWYKANLIDLACNI